MWAVVGKSQGMCNILELVELSTTEYSGCTEVASRSGNEQSRKKKKKSKIRLTWT